MISVAICTAMDHCLEDLLKSLTSTACGEILLVGTQGHDFKRTEHFNDPRVRMLYTAHDLASKRNLAIEEAKGDIIAFIDDDAVASRSWHGSLEKAFGDPSVGIVTGPSILPENATYWEKTAQLVMSSAQYSKKRYDFYQEGYVDWYDVIGANFAFRKQAIIEAGRCPIQFKVAGDDMAMSHNVVKAGWKVYYSPKSFVYHKPHPFFPQLRQIYRWGKSATKLKRAGVSLPPRDRAYYLFMPVWALFAFLYLSGLVKETFFGRNNKKKDN